MNGTAAETSPELLQDAMITKITDAGYTLSPRAEQALRAVDRHLFVPDATLEQAYENSIVVTKWSDDEQVLSCLSQPSIVALQLGQLDVQLGHRVLEIGAGTGYNAAVLAYLAGPHGHVTAIDVDADIVEQARERLAAAGVGNVEVVLGDGALGYGPGAPYDRIVATVGAWGIPEAWLAQLAPTGRLVVPTRIRGSVSRSIAFERDEDGLWRSVDHKMCSFVPLRSGIADDPRRRIPLTADNAVTLQLHQEHAINPAELMGVLTLPRFEAWTGVTFGPMQSLEWLYLRLACVLDASLCSLFVDPAAVEAGLVKPMFRAYTMAVPGEGELAYLTWRRAGHTENGGKIMEIGVIGHSAAGSAFADHVAGEVRTWGEQQRIPTVQFEISPTGTHDPQAGKFVLDRPHHRLTAIWQ
ncbi:MULTISPECIES: methyltransferase, FxLD system [unclassified Crossiella]|uniref:methyltransferase, FxLD system n=1 Tax=unclassified Crossiella TaxID=2620835 RepID=UPI001FFF73D6|nr:MULTISPECIES: methyltransferase, FxLD system [unclassified Crossiella]MCK2245208.1 methyltransferase, FxLD system [Crossiella sp. S99.2]MCK2258870.1 methyltransferase, FxLD system [Crossiella sp. S99.1]